VITLEPVLLEAATTRKIVAPPRGPAVTVNRSIRKVDPPPATLTFSRFTTDEEIANARVLPGPLLPLPLSGGFSSFTENRALAHSLLAYHRSGDPDDTSPLTRFLDEHPGSRYEASLLTNLGVLYRDQGSVSRAFPRLTRAWSLTKDGTDKNSLAVANWALAELAEMYAHLDRTRRGQLDAVLDRLGSRDLHGPTTEKVSVALQERAQLRQNPEEAFRCGPVSLALLREYLRLPRDPAIENVKASRQGFSLAALEDLANVSGMKMRAVHREPGAPVPFPSIIHWQYDHYSAILERKEERGKEYFRLENPLLDNGRWMSREALDEESSGYYLVAGDRNETGWRTAAKAEAGNVWGRCLFSAFDLTQLMAWAVKTIHDIFAPSCGMPHYDFHAALASLNIVDTPLGYTPPLGPPVQFTVTYNQKESFQPAIFTYSNLGPKWTFDWFSSVQGAGGTTRVYLRGGGAEITGQPNSRVNDQLFFNNDSQSHAQLVATHIIPYEYERRLPDGSKEVFTQKTNNGSVFLTQVVDAHGNAIRFTYDSKFRMVAVTDAIGQVTTLSYDLLADPLKITKVTDPFGRSAIFSYDPTGHLTQITDVIGMSSTFVYGPNDFVQSMNTPYGTTSFQTGHGPDTADVLNTYIQATDDFGAQRAEFRNTVPGFAPHDAWNNALSAATPPVPDMNTRITSYWDKNAWKRAPGDYTQARSYQWLHSRGAGSATGIFDYTKNALEGRVMYEYAGQTQPFFNFFSAPEFSFRTSAQPSVIMRLLEDGKSQQTTKIESNNFGHITKNTDTLGRQTQYLYDSNQVDLLQVVNVNMSETLAQISYNSQHLPTSSIDASEQTTTYTYNAAGQILTVTDAKGQTSSFAYDPSAYLSSVTGPYPGATTTFTYDAFGRAASVTTSDGYTLAYDYDGLDRLTKVTYPDGTFSQTTYDKLDPVASTDRQGRVTATAYDSLRRPISITDPLGQTTKLTWCGCGGLASMTDPKGNTTTWNRDVQARVTSKVFADGSSIQYSYDAMTGRLVGVTDPKGQVTSNQYFPDGNLRQTTYSATSTPTSPVTFAYDPNTNRVTSFTDGTGTTRYSYLPAGILGALQVASVTGPRGDETDYAYDELGRVVSRKIDGVPVNLSYDSLGRVVNETNPLGNFGYSYVNATDRLQSVNYPNGQSSQYTYFDSSGDNRLSKILHLDPNQNLLSQFDHTYTATGEMTSVTRQAPELNGAPSTYQFNYDASRQLSTASLTTGDGAGVASYTYNYDPAGNRILEQINGSAAPIMFNSLNQVTNFQYDKNGNLKSDGSRIFEWDVADRLTAIVAGSHRSEFSYDGLDRRIRITEQR
jgi:YD repeat-containing protein